jgi:AcrR family transcriptional regulator
MSDKRLRRTQGERSAATRAALLAAARELFAEHGFGEVGTEAIVQAAGVTRGALYHQFADKTALFAAVFEALETDLARQLIEQIAATGTDDPMAELEIGVRAWLDACEQPAVQQIVLLDAPAVLGWERWREIGLRHGRGLVEAVLSAAMERGQIARQPAGALAHALLGALDEAALYIARAEDPAAARAEMELVIGHLLRGLATG